MDIDTHNELETKAGIPLDAVVTHGEMMRAFEAFKEANDQRLALTDTRAMETQQTTTPSQLPIERRRLLTHYSKDQKKRDADSADEKSEIDDGGNTDSDN